MSKNKSIKDLVSVIIVNWNGKHFLEGCLTTLYNQTYSNIEVIFVDNNSKDDSISYVKDHFPNMKLIINGNNYGFAKGNHIGLKKCAGEYIFLLNNDTELKEDAIENLVSTIQDDKIAGACGKIMSLSDKDKCIFTLPKIDHITGKAIWVNKNSQRRAVDYLSGNSLMFKKKVIDEIGFFDNAYFAYFEETDLCARAIRAGYDLIYEPTAIIWHKEMGTTPTWFNRYYMARNQIRFILKNFDLKYIPRAIFLNFKEIIKAGLNKNTTIPEFKTTNEKIELKYNLKFLIAKAIIWNIIFCPLTFYARYRDLKLIGKKIRSYNKNLPLSDYMP